MYVFIVLNGLQYLVVFNFKICVFMSIMVYVYKGVLVYYFYLDFIKCYMFQK